MAKIVSSRPVSSSPAVFATVPAPLVRAPLCWTAVAIWSTYVVYCALSMLNGGAARNDWKFEYALIDCFSRSGKPWRTSSTTTRMRPPMITTARTSATSTASQRGQWCRIRNALNGTSSAEIRMAIMNGTTIARRLMIEQAEHDQHADDGEDAPRPLPGDLDRDRDRLFDGAFAVGTGRAVVVASPRRRGGARPPELHRFSLEPAPGGRPAEIADSAECRFSFRREPRRARP